MQEKKHNLYHTLLIYSWENSERFEIHKTEEGKGAKSISSFLHAASAIVFNGKNNNCVSYDMTWSSHVALILHNY